MSQTVTIPGVTTNDKPGDNKPQPDAFILSAGDLIKQQARVLADAKRMEHSAYQITSAILMAMAAHEGYVPAVIETGKNAGKEVGTDITTRSLMACDGDRSVNGAGPLYNAASIFVAKQLGCGMQTANDIVEFTARLLRAGYTLDNFNGVIGEEDGRLTLELADYDPNMPAHLIPGMFRIKPIHAARDKAHGFFKDATLAKMVKVQLNGVDVDMPAPSDVQELCIMDKAHVFLVDAPDKDGTRKAIRVRVGRNTVFLAMDAALKAEKEEAERNARAARDAANPPPAPKPGDAGPANPARGEGEGQPATTPPAGSTVVTPATSGTPAGTTAPAPAAQPNGTATANGTPPTAQPATTANDMRVNEDRTREDSEKLANALTPDKLVEHARTVFSHGRVKDDEQVRRQAFMLYAHLHGILTNLGYAEIIANPTDQTIRDAKVVKPANKPANNKPVTASKK